MKTILLRFRATLFSLLVGAGLIGHPPSASALVIDDFTQGPLAIQAITVAGLTTVQTGLPPALTIGGTRSVYVGSLDLAGVQVETGKGRFNFFATSGFGYFKLDWGSVTPLNANLSAGGNNRFQIEFVDVTPNVTLNLFTLRVKSANTWFNYELGNDLTTALHGDTFGILSIPFTKFGGANLAEVQAIELEVARAPSGFHLSIDSITAVPEPAGAALLGLSSALALVARRKAVRN